MLLSERQALAAERNGKERNGNANESESALLLEIMIYDLRMITGGDELGLTRFAHPWSDAW